MKYLLVIGLSLGMRVAGACDCLFLTMQQAYRAADYVVRARVIALRDTVHYDLYSNPVRPPFRSGYLPVLRINKLYKGRLSSRQQVYLTAGSGTMCDAYFQQGAEYLLFINKYKGEYTTSTCQRSFLLTDTVSLKEFELLVK
ncbi:hypothetical protein FNT36_01145 [Hymenobacter setariae]|uniref:Uncharacterized protein n=2 Tax=Hymenobacter setariae TaxID=2594794 RepID=A0A558C1S4_9BACT|nr:hypothetical protein FNT36_01145 [Hymenobacter setariae]